MTSLRPTLLRSTSPNTSPTPTDNTLAQPSVQLAALDSKLTEFMAQQLQFNNHLSEILNNQSMQLKEIKNITKNISEQQLRINKLEKQNASLAKNLTDISQQTKALNEDVTVIKNNLKISSQPTPEIIISGVPSNLNIETDTIIESILTAIDATRFVNDVIDIRQVTGKNKSNTENTTLQSKSSYIIKFKSEHVARHIIMLKRRKGLLKMHTLYCKAKDLIKQHKWKYVWIKNGKIAVRKNESSQMIEIYNDIDLLKINSD
ncbi:hypothetical protein PV325_009858 [Microctonus aethiopoides]|nr:hypothetical protein PV325_009858 [Microctonus aethiopoides]